MKKCLFSTYIKTDDMDVIKEEIELFNAMKRIAFSNVRILGGDKTVKENLSIHMFLKSQYAMCQIISSIVQDRKRKLSTAVPWKC